MGKIKEIRLLHGDTHGKLCIRPDDSSRLEEMVHGVMLTRGSESVLHCWSNIREVHYEIDPIIGKMEVVEAIPRRRGRKAKKQPQLAQRWPDAKAS